MFDQETVSAARERDGQVAENRDPEIDDLLDWRQLGYENGEPLAADSYSRYPDTSEELSNPKYTELIRRLFAAVNGYDEAVQELTSGTGDRLIRRDWREGLKAAADAAGIDAGALFVEGTEADCDGPDAALTALTDDLDDQIISEQNPLCLAYLYVNKGLSVAEIAKVFESEDDQIRSRLFDVGLVQRKADRPKGKTAEEILVNIPEDDGNPSLDVDTEAVANDPNVTISKEE